MLAAIPAIWIQKLQDVWASLGSKHICGMRSSSSSKNSVEGQCHHMSSSVKTPQRNSVGRCCFQTVPGTKIRVGVSKNRDTPKWMVYNGKPYEQMDDLGGKPTIFGSTHVHKTKTHQKPTFKVLPMCPSIRWSNSQSSICESKEGRKNNQKRICHANFGKIGMQKNDAWKT